MIETAQIFASEFLSIKTLKRLTTYPAVRQVPKNEVMVVARAAPSKRYADIRIIFKTTDTGTKTNAISMETLGLPLAVIMVIRIENMVKKPRPKIKILNEEDAGKYLEE